MALQYRYPGLYSKRTLQTAQKDDLPGVANLQGHVHAHLVAVCKGLSQTLSQTLALVFLRVVGKDDFKDSGTYLHDGFVAHLLPLSHSLHAAA